MKVQMFVNNYRNDYTLARMKVLVGKHYTHLNYIYLSKANAKSKPQISQIEYKFSHTGVFEGGISFSFWTEHETDFKSYSLSSCYFVMYIFCLKRSSIFRIEEISFYSRRGGSGFKRLGRGKSGSNWIGII